FQGTLAAGSVGLRVGAVDGETVGESMLAGFGEMMGAVTREQREANVQTSAPRVDAALGQLGRDLAAGAEGYVGFLKTGLTVLVSFMPGGMLASGFIAGADRLQKDDIVGAAIDVAWGASFGALSKLGQALKVCYWNTAAKTAFNFTAGFVVGAAL